MSLTTDPTDPRLGHGVDTEPIPQHEVYLVLSEEERAKGFVRPVRTSYQHAGPVGPSGPLRDLTAEESEMFSAGKYAKFEAYSSDLQDGVRRSTGKFWRQDQLDAVVSGGCGTVTTMGRELAETYAREPKFYGATYCCGCQKHLPVGEFRWENDGEVVGS